jgi:hypothetical protein
MLFPGGRGFTLHLLWEGPQGLSPSGWGLMLHPLWEGSCTILWWEGLQAPPPVGGASAPPGPGGLQVVIFPGNFTLSLLPGEPPELQRTACPTW